MAWAAKGLGVAFALLVSFAGPVQSDFPPLIDLAVDDPDALIIGAGAQALMRSSMCTGDINGDGFLDLVVAACNAKPLGGARQGETFIIWGPALADSGTIDLAIEQNQVSRIFGQPGDDAVYCQVACGDFNINATYDGRATLLYGRPVLPDTVMLSDGTWPKTIVMPEYTHGALGGSVAIGDVESDGQYDLVVGAYQGDPQGCEDCGEVYVLYNAAGLPDTVDVGSTGLPITRLIGDESTIWLGICVLVDDLNNDYREDIVVANWPESRRARTCIAYGPMLPADTIFQDTDTTLTRIIEESLDSNLGRALASGDFNGDSVGDLVLGAKRASPSGRSNAGAAYVFYGVASPTGVKTPELPPALVVKPNFPNPFSTNTSFQFYLPRNHDVTVTVYDVLGRRIATILKPLLERGENIVTWNGRDDYGKQLPSGVYFYRVEAASFSQTRKFVLTR